MFTLSTFYTSKQWRLFRKTVISERLARDGDVICDYCKRPIVNDYDIIAHHYKTFLTEANVNDYNISLNQDNIQLVHLGCHNKIHNNFGTCTYKKVYLVFGSPGAGKSTYINEVADSNSLIVDIDRIYEAINNQRSKKLYSNVMQLFNQLIDVVRTRNGAWSNAYIILANCRNVERYQKLLDAEVIHINTDKQICYERAAPKINKYGQPYKDYIDNYWREWTETYSKLLIDMYDL